MRIAFLPVLVLGVGMTVHACGSTAEGDDPLVGKSCKPGAAEECACPGGEPGVRICDKLFKQWTPCMCGDAASGLSGMDLVEGEDGSALKPSGGPARQGFTAGGGALQSENYRLLLFVAPTSPVARGDSENFVLYVGTPPTGEL